MELHPVGDAPDLRGACVVLPAVAFFNVGELAVDALVSTLGLTLAARLGSQNLLPVVGNDPYEHSGAPGLLATALELYSSGPGSKLFVLQQRAPAIPGRQRALASELATFLAASGASDVIILSGLDAQYRHESQLEGPQARHITAAQFAAAAASSSAAAPAAHVGAPRGDAEGAAAAEAARKALEGLSLAGHEAAAAAAATNRGAPLLEADAVARELELHPLLPPWPLLGALAAARVPAALLGRFAAEGDNVADALALAALAIGVLSSRPGLLPAQLSAAAAAGAGAGSSSAAAGGGQVPLKTPPSWAGLYGRPQYEEVM